MIFDTRIGQMLLAKKGLYSAAVDGDFGPKTMAGVILSEHNAGFVAPVSWSPARRLIAASQRILNDQGYAAGVVDGLFGMNTAEAVTSWLSAARGMPSDVARKPFEHIPVSDAIAATPRQADLTEFYGPAGGHDCTAGKVGLPIPFMLAWDRDQWINSFSCHEKVARPLTAIFVDAVRYLGRERFEELDLHVFGGCFNFRKMRGGSSLSTHAWGIAVDLNPEKNQLRWGADRAQFARPEYDDWWRIVKSHGATPAGHAWGKDWMHFQFARL